MLKLVSVKKDYTVGEFTVHALKGVDLSFREHEFVAILGHSGCGKTTLLNIVGGLDQYTSGDLVINGKSTKNFSDGDWDTYRNHSIGFVFQSYNLIPHLTAVENVILGVSGKGGSSETAKDHLRAVGLDESLKVEPLRGVSVESVRNLRLRIHTRHLLDVGEIVHGERVGNEQYFGVPLRA